MSVLVQRPHQAPGLMSLQRQHAKASQISSPSRRAIPNHAPVASPRQTRKNQRSPAAAPVSEPTSSPTPVLQTRSSKRRNNINVNSGQQHSVPSSLLPPSATIVSSASHNESASTISPLITTTVTPTPTTPPTNPQVSRKNKATAAPSTPTRNGFASNRPPRARTPPEFPFDHENLRINHPVTPANNTFIPTPASSPINKRNRRNINNGALLSTPSTPGNTSNFDKTWKQPVSFNGVAMSTPSSPAAAFPLAANFPIHRPSTTSHQRAPSHPTFPMHRQNSDTFSAVKPTTSSSLEALFNSAINLNDEPVAQPTTPHKRGVSVSSSVPMGMGIHARMAAAAAAQSGSPRQRTLTGGNGTPGGRGFAGASFQHAPDAMSMPNPFAGVKLGKFGALSNGSSSSLSLTSGSGSESERVVIDLSEAESEDEVFFA
ncbi:hypothetical protein FRB98_006095 [Tulasnella sp. 332]|nr:hypothetical protein FRB98_006095 [Tulasnella sp. 332]